MPPPTDQPKTLLETTILAAMLAATTARSDAANRAFIQLICSPQEIKLLNTKEKIEQAIAEQMTTAALKSGASIASHLAVIRKAMELAADKAELNIWVGNKSVHPLKANTFSRNAEGLFEDITININKQSILDIEKLFL